MSTIEALSSLSPRLNELEEERLFLLRKNKNEAFIGVIGAIGGSLFVYALWLWPQLADAELYTYIKLLFWTTVISFLIISYYRNERIAVFENKVKSAIVNEVIGTLDPQLAYDPEGNIYNSEFKASGIFYEQLSRFNCEDTIEGEIDGIPFRLAEIKAEKKVGKNSYHTFFHGPFLVMELPRNFAGETYILPAHYKESLGNKIQRKLWGGGRVGEKIKLPDSNFNRVFQVISNNPMSVRNILTEKFKADLQRFSRGIYVSFIGKRAYMALNNNRDLMAINMNVSLLNKGIVSNIKDELELLLRLVKNLDVGSYDWGY